MNESKKTKNKMKKTFLIIFAAVIVLAPAFFADAADYLPKTSQNAGSVTVGGSEEYRNLYVGGGSVVINKQVLGDLFAAGGSVNVAGPTENDLFAVSGNLNVTSPVGEDARLAGGNVAITAPIGGDLLLAGGTLSLSADAHVGGDMWAAGGVVNMSNSVAGNAKIAGGEIFINGIIDGKLEVRADEKLVFGPQSKVLQNITYFGRNEAVVEEGAQVGMIEFTRVTGKKAVAAKAFGGFFVLKLLALLVASLILFKLFPKTSSEITSSTYKKFWANLGIGVLGLIAVPIVAIILMVTVVGAYAGVALLVWFILSALLGGLYGIMFLGGLIDKWFRKTKNIELRWLSLLWGVIAGGVLMFVPFVGWLAVFVLYLASFGGWLRAMKGRVGS